MSLHIQGRIDVRAKVGDGHDDAPPGKYNDGKVEDARRPLCEGIETLEGLLLKEFGGAPRFFVEPSSMFSDLD